MNQKQAEFIFPFSTEAGSCLTFANWQELAVTSLSFSLDALLMKPGFDFLQGLSSLGSYCGWQGTIVVNADFAVANKEGVYHLRSVYDGSLLRIERKELFSLMQNLQADKLILPQDFISDDTFDWQSLSDKTQLFVPFKEDSQAYIKHGVGNYFHYDKSVNFSQFINQIQQTKEKTSYVKGAFEPDELAELIAAGVTYLESDKPAADALQGRLYTKDGDFDLLAEEKAFDYQLIDSQCSCPTCSQGFNRAYLHHLLAHTPLLCQRFLIQHNVHYYLAQGS